MYYKLQPASRWQQCLTGCPPPQATWKITCTVCRMNTFGTGCVGRERLLQATPVAFALHSPLYILHYCLCMYYMHICPFIVIARPDSWCGRAELLACFPHFLPFVLQRPWRTVTAWCCASPWATSSGTSACACGIRGAHSLPHTHLRRLASSTLASTPRAPTTLGSSWGSLKSRHRTSTCVSFWYAWVECI